MDATYSIDPTEGAFGLTYLNPIRLRLSLVEAEVLQHGGSISLTLSPEPESQTVSVKATGFRPAVTAVQALWWRGQQGADRMDHEGMNEEPGQ